MYIVSIVSLHSSIHTIYNNHTSYVYTIHNMLCIGSSPELSAFAASCRFRKVAWILVLQIPALLVQNKTHMVNMDEAPNFHKMLKPELKLNTCEAMVQKLLARKLLLFRCSMMASLVLFSLF